MNRRHSRAAAMIAIAAGTLVVAACTGSTNGPTSSPGGTSSGNVSPGAGLAAVTPAGTKPVSSVVWATNRDVISLDPIKSWTPGAGVVAVRNPHYCDRWVHPLVGQITLKGVPDVTSLTAGLLTGAIQGVYGVGLPTLAQLKDSNAVRVDVQPDTVLVLSKGLTGAVSSSAYLSSPWADQLGGTG